MVLQSTSWQQSALGQVARDPHRSGGQGASHEAFPLFREKHKRGNRTLQEGITVPDIPPTLPEGTSLEQRLFSLFGE